MAVPTISSPRKEKKRKQPLEGTTTELQSPPRKRTKSPGVRVVGNRIYDSERGKTCHQCRQKTMDFAARCSNFKKGKQCTIQFCHKCLLNRYGENAEEVAAKGNWICPKCRGICNCSFCMKKRGHQPTGILSHTAKAIGCSSVSEMLMLHQTDSLPENLKKQVASGKKSETKNSLQEGKKSVTASDLSCTKMKKKKDRIEKKIQRDSSSNQSKKHNAPSEKQSAKFKSKENARGSNLEREIQSSRGVKLERKTLIQGEESEKVRTKSGKKETKKTVDQSNGSLTKKESDPIRKKIKKKEFMDAGVNNVNIDGVLKADGEKTHTKSIHPPKPKGEMPNEGDTKIQAVTKGISKNLPKKKNPKPELAVPGGTTLKTIASIEFQIEDVGPALQFLEFCSVFGKLVGLTNGQPESILRELVSGRGVRRGLNSKIVQFYIKVLSMIGEERGDEDVSYTENDGTWMRAIQECIDEAHISFDGLNLNSIAKSSSGYATLDPSKKLKILNFLCDELLGTSKARNFMDSEKTIFDENKKEEREKRKILEKKLKDEAVQAMLESRNGAPLSVLEQLDILAKTKTELKKSHASSGLLDEKRAGVIRTAPVLLEGGGRVYWRLKGYDTARILLQDIGELGSTVPQDEWFCYEIEEEKALQKHLSRIRLRNRSEKRPPSMVQEA